MASSRRRRSHDLRTTELHEEKAINQYHIPLFCYLSLHFSTLSSLFIISLCLHFGLVRLPYFTAFTCMERCWFCFLCFVQDLSPHVIYIPSCFIDCPRPFLFRYCLEVWDCVCLAIATPTLLLIPSVYTVGSGYRISGQEVMVFLFRVRSERTATIL